MHINILKLVRIYNELLHVSPGARGGAVAINRKVAGSIPDGVIGIFH